MINKAMNIWFRLIPLVFGLLALFTLYLSARYNGIINEYIALDNYEHNINILVISNRLTAIHIQTSIYVTASLFSSFLLIKGKHKE
jgi:hypothetical protein